MGGDRPNVFLLSLRWTVRIARVFLLLPCKFTDLLEPNDLLFSSTVLSFASVVECEHGQLG